MFPVTYDVWEPDYPEASAARVCFLSDHMLYDVGMDATFSWRLEGDSWDESDDEDEADGSFGAEAPPPSAGGAGGAGSVGAVGATGDEGESGLAVADPAAFVDDLLSGILAKHGDKMARLPYLQQVRSVRLQARANEREREGEIVQWGLVWFWKKGSRTSPWGITLSALPQQPHPTSPYHATGLCGVGGGPEQGQTDGGSRGHLGSQARPRYAPPPPPFHW